MAGTLIRSTFLETGGYVSDATVTLIGVAAGNRIFLTTHIWDNDAGYGEQSPNSVVSTPVETWTQDFNSNIATRSYWNNSGGDGASGGNRLSIWSAIAASSGTYSITAYWYGSKPARITAFEFSGIPAGAMDVAAQNNVDPIVSGSSVSVSTGALGTNSEVIFALSVLDTTGAGGAITKPTAFTAVADRGSFAVDYLNVSSNASVSATWNLGSSPQGALNAALVAYKSTIILANITAPIRTFAVSSSRTAVAPTAMRMSDVHATTHTISLAQSIVAPTVIPSATPTAYNSNPIIAFSAVMPIAGVQIALSVGQGVLLLQGGGNFTLQDTTNFNTIMPNAGIPFAPLVAFSVSAVQSGSSTVISTRNYSIGSAFSAPKSASSSVGNPANYVVGVSNTFSSVGAPRNFLANPTTYSVFSQYSIGTLESTDYLMLQDLSPLSLHGGGNLYFHSNNQIIAVTNSRITAYTALSTVSASFVPISGTLYATPPARSFSLSFAFNTAFGVATPAIPNAYFVLSVGYQPSGALSAVNANPIAFSKAPSFIFDVGAATAVRRAIPSASAQSLVGTFARSAPSTIRQDTSGSTTFNLTLATTLVSPNPIQQSLITAGAPVVTAAYTSSAPSLGFVAKPVALNRTVTGAFIGQPATGMRQALPAASFYASSAAMTMRTPAAGVTVTPPSASYAVTAARSIPPPDSFRNGIPEQEVSAIRLLFNRPRPSVQRGVIPNSVLRNASVMFQPFSPKTTHTAAHIYITLRFKQPYTATMKIN
jgi:hypothetical protein